MDQSQPIAIQQQEEPIAAGGGRRARDRFSTVLYLRQLCEHEEKKPSSSRSIVGDRPDLPHQSSLVLPKPSSLLNVPNLTPASSTRSNFNSMSMSSSSGSARSKAQASSLVGEAVGDSMSSSFGSVRSKASSRVGEPVGASGDDSASSFDFDGARAKASRGDIRSSWSEREGARRKQKGPNPFAFF